MLPISDNSVAIACAPAEVSRAGSLVSLLRLRWFIKLRWTITLMGLAALTLEHLVVPEVNRPRGLWWVVLTIGVVNVGWTALSHFLTRRMQDAPTEAGEVFRTARLFANAQVATDLLLLTLVIRFTGGAESPLAMFYVFHMAISSLLLKASQAIGQGVWAVTLYGLLGVAELRGWIGQHYDFFPLVPCTGQYAHAVFVVVAVAVVACGVFGVLFFTLRIVSRLDDREKRLRATVAALRQSQDAIQDLQARRSRFMQTAAHQLKSPLAGIQTLANLIRDGVIQGDGVGAMCSRIGRRCREGIVAVSELLTLARVQDADPARHVSALADVSDVVREICNQRKLQAKDAGVKLTCCGIPDSPLQAHVDSTDLRDCVDNLLDNAIKYTPRGGEVEVCVEKRGADQVRREAGNGRVDHGDTNGALEYVAVVVRDTGIGIDPDEFDGAGGGTATVFDAFRRGNAALGAGIAGSGLGLAIVRSVVEQAGGRIQVVSRPGGGSTFVALFPSEQSLPEGPRVPDTRSSQVLVERADVVAPPVQPSAEEPNHA